MLRDIPRQYTRARLLAHLDAAGFLGSYDLVYLPMNRRKRTAFGYAIVNLTSTDAAERLMRRFDGFTAWSVPSNKRCKVSWKGLQGLEAHIECFRSSGVMEAGVPEEFQPVLFSNGRRIPFPHSSASGSEARPEVAHSRAPDGPRADEVPRPFKLLRNLF